MTSAVKSVVLLFSLVRKLRLILQIWACPDPGIVIMPRFLFRRPHGLSARAREGPSPVHTGAFRETL